jgi:hypothetical protein
MKRSPFSAEELYALNGGEPGGVDTRLMVLCRCLVNRIEMGCGYGEATTAAMDELKTSPSVVRDTERGLHRMTL